MLAPRVVSVSFFSLLALLLWAASTRPAQAQNIIPGTGHKLDGVGDDFEDASWAYIPQGPKSSHNLDEQTRLPGGQSRNGRWFESSLRGHPDRVERVATPAGGLAGSQGALLMRTVQSGVPGRASRQAQQDDLLMKGPLGFGNYLPVSRGPSAVVRVYLPPFDEWEPRTGATFGFRAEVRGARNKPSGGFLLSRSTSEREPYWPGLFIHFRKARQPSESDSGVFIVRAGERGQDFQGPEITSPGWWTLGMSFSPDGRIHYYARPGVEPLTAADHIASHYPYGFRCEGFNTIFFDVFNQDDGRSWSTAWIIDDPAIYVQR